MNRLGVTHVLAMLAAPSVFTGELSVEITGITDIRGQIIVAIYDSPEAFEAEDKPLAARHAVVDGETVAVNFENINLGEHAAKLYHDANGNGKLDRNLLGLPSEGYGFSNNTGRFGPPSFEEARFTIDAETRIRVRLR